VLVVILGLNSAIAAYYYLRLVAVSLLDEPQGSTYAPTTVLARPLAGAVSAFGVIALIAFAEPLMQAATRAGRVAPMTLGLEAESLTPKPAGTAHPSEAPSHESPGALTPPAGGATAEGGGH
jgi:hypothetical protein